MTRKQRFLSKILDEEEKEIAEALLDIVTEKQAAERAEDEAAGLEVDDVAPVWDDAKIARLKELHAQETGAFLYEIEDEGERNAEWVKWVKTKLTTHSRMKPMGPSELQQMEIDTRKNDPVYAAIAEAVETPQYAQSFTTSEFMPSEHGHH